MMLKSVLLLFLFQPRTTAKGMLQLCSVTHGPRSILDQPSEADPRPLEWIIALIFTFYVFTFFMDLLPAARANQLASGVRHTDISQINTDRTVRT